MRSTYCLTPRGGVYGIYIRCRTYTCTQCEPELIAAADSKEKKWYICVSVDVSAGHMNSTKQIPKYLIVVVQKELYMNA